MPNQESTSSSLEQKRKFYVSYAVVKDPSFPGGAHAFLAVTDYTPPHPPEIIFRVGFMGRVILEDFLIPKPGREFFHKTYPMTSEQLTLFLGKINSDRRLSGNSLSEDDCAENSRAVEEKLLKLATELDKNHESNVNDILAQLGDADEDVKKAVKGYHDKRFQKEKEEELKKKRKEYESRPGGPEFSLLTSNCKIYALCLLKKIGIVDKTLENPGISMPRFSGTLLPLKFYRPQKETEVLRWDSPFVISAGENYDTYSILVQNPGTELEILLEFIQEYENELEEDEKKTIRNLYFSLENQYENGLPLDVIRDIINRTCSDFTKLIDARQDNPQEIVSLPLIHTPPENPLERLKWAIMFYEVKNPLETCLSNLHSIFEIEFLKLPPAYIQRTVDNVCELLSALNSPIACNKEKLFAIRVFKDHVHSWRSPETGVEKALIGVATAAAIFLLASVAVGFVASMGLLVIPAIVTAIALYVAVGAGTAFFMSSGVLMGNAVHKSIKIHGFFKDSPNKKALKEIASISEVQVNSEATKKGVKEVVAAPVNVAETPVAVVA